MEKTKKIFYTDYLYANSLDETNKLIEEFCEVKSEEHKNFKLVSHSITIEKNTGTYYEFDEEFKIPDTYIIHIVYSFDLEDLETYLCINLLTIDTPHPYIVKFKAKDIENALSKAVNFFKLRGYHNIQKENILCILNKTIKTNS